MYTQAKSVEQARQNCQEARRRLARHGAGTTAHKHAVADLRRFEAQAATLAARVSA
jgi:hypothetical protein